MKTWPETQSSLLVRLPNRTDRDAWAQFTAVYCPAIYQFARRRGLQHADADELVQRVTMRVFQSAGGWRGEKPPRRFRAWLLRVARNALINMVSRETRQRARGGSDGGFRDDRVAATDADRQVWEQEMRRQQMLVAAQSVRKHFDDDNWQAFWRTSVAGEPVQQVAEELGKTCGAVYATRARIVNRLREAVEKLNTLQCDTSDWPASGEPGAKS